MTKTSRIGTTLENPAWRRITHDGGKMGYFQGDTCHKGTPEKLYPECLGKVFRQPEHALFLLTVTTDKEFKSGHSAPIGARRRALDVGKKRQWTRTVPTVSGSLEVDLDRFPLRVRIKWLAFDDNEEGYLAPPVLVRLPVWVWLSRSAQALCSNPL